MIDNNYKGHNLVFIVGAPRSGTTWLQKLLFSIDGIYTGQESDLFDEYIGPQLRYWYRDLVLESSGRPVGLGCYFTQEEFIKKLKTFLTALLEPMVSGLKPGEIFVEKTPSHAIYIPEIIELLPEAKIIHIVRDPRDVVGSLIAASKSWAKNSAWAPNSIRQALQMWVGHVKAVCDTRGMVPKEQFYEMHYEDLLDNTDMSLTKLVQGFLKFKTNKNDILSAIEANSIDSNKTGKGVKIPLAGEFGKMAREQIVEPEGFIRKGIQGSFKKELSWIKKRYIKKVAGYFMKQFGYL